LKSIYIFNYFEIYPKHILELTKKNITYLKKKIDYGIHLLTKKKYVAHSLAHLAIKKKLKIKLKKYIKDQMIKETIR
jgi:hypothetical protein